MTMLTEKDVAILHAPQATSERMKQIRFPEPISCSFLTSFDPKEAARFDHIFVYHPRAARMLEHFPEESSTIMNDLEPVILTDEAHLAEARTLLEYPIKGLISVESMSERPELYLQQLEEYDFIADPGLSFEIAEHNFQYKFSQRPIESFELNHEQIPESVTKQERLVLYYLINGYSTQKTADEMHYSLKTIKRYIGNLMRRTGCTERTSCIVYAIRHHWVTSVHRLPER
ncbi:response regulator transcription factor [Bacillus daqingensis]|uniref:Response regulator transcription factor n=1 Tax=Bacillus daqingensis TaxID=872396 RepID=A0ABV9NXF1_9BACI